MKRHAMGLACMVALIFSVACGDSSPVSIDEVNPPGGPLSGGTRVTIDGTGFQLSSAGATAVFVGGVPATNVQVNSDTSVTFTTPAGSEVGDAELLLVNQRGVGQGTFNYGELVQITAASPNTANYKGGATVTLTGNGFTSDAPLVFFNDRPATDINIVSDTEMSVVVPAGIGMAPVTIEVRTDNGVGAATGIFYYGGGIGGIGYIRDDFRRLRRGGPRQTVVEQLSVFIDPTPGEEVVQVTSLGTPVIDGGTPRVSALTLDPERGDFNVIFGASGRRNGEAVPEPYCRLTRWLPGQDPAVVGEEMMTPDCQSIQSLTEHQGSLLGFCRSCNSATFPLPTGGPGGSQSRSLGNIDKASGLYSPLPGISMLSRRSAIASDGTTVYLVTGDDPNIYSLSTSDQMLTELGLLSPYYEMRELFFHDGQLYGLTRRVPEPIQCGIGGGDICNNGPGGPSSEFGLGLVRIDTTTFETELVVTIPANIRSMTSVP